MVKTIKIIDEYLIGLFSILFFFLCLIWTLKNYTYSLDLNNNIQDAIREYNFNPYISVFIDKTISILFGKSVKIILGFIIIPSLCFYFLSKLFNQYLSKLFSISLSLLGLISFTSLNFFDFLLNLLNLKLIYFNKSLAIMSFPIPSLSTLFFILLFIYSINYNRSKLTTTFLTILWTLMCYVHPIDFIFGIIFWFFYFTIIRFLKVDKENIIEKLLLIFSQILLCLFLLIPSYIQYDFTNLYSDKHQLTTNTYYIFVYFVCPIILIFILYLVKKIDYKEILLKFLHVYVLMIVEFFLLVSPILLPFAIDPFLIENRITLFFLHLYYYVPVIYYGSMPSVTNKNYYVKKLLEKAVFQFFNLYSYYYLILFDVLLIVFFIISI